jgi:hypothetical protein
LDLCYDFKNIFAKNFSKKLFVLFCSKHKRLFLKKWGWQKWLQTYTVFKEKRQYFRRKLVKIGENW